MTSSDLLERHELSNQIQLKQGLVSIGRAADNDFPVTDKTVSSHHAQIYTYREVSFIEDLGSTNGTFLNGKRIKKHIVNAGDIIAVGKHKFTISK